VLSGDDPGAFGYNDLTVDYYLAYMAWGLDLYDLRVIANNSIQYSLSSAATKLEGYAKFNLEWRDFIETAYARICGSLSPLDANVDDRQLNVSDLLPSYGPSDTATEITIYGYGFEIALCEEIYCNFEDVQVEAVLAGLGQIRCSTPIGFDADTVVKVSLQIDDVMYDTGFVFKFVAAVSDPSAPVVEDHLDYDNQVSTSIWVFVRKCDKAVKETIGFNLSPFLLIIFVVFLICVIKARAPPRTFVPTMSPNNHRNLKQLNFNI
jgi:hypothetical protein